MTDAAAVNQVAGTETKVEKAAKPVRLTDREKFMDGIFPLETFSRFKVDDERYKSLLTKELQGPYRGFKLFKEIVDALYAFDPATHSTPPPFDKDDWRDMLNDVEVGTVKETDNFGTTSVSFGLACEIFDHCPETAMPFDKTGKRYLLLLNGGTGGFKCQVAAEDKCTKLRSFVMEHKAKETNAHPNGQTLASYAPEGGNACSPEQEVQNARAWFQEACNSLQKKLDLDLWNSPHILCFAFMTGPSRAHWEKSAVPEQRLMDEAMLAYLEQMAAPCANVCAPWKRDPTNNSFFMPQVAEGEFEFKAAVAMYTQAFMADLVLRLPLVVASAGLGNGSMQFDEWQEEIGLKSKEERINDLVPSLKRKLATTDLAQTWYDTFQPKKVPNAIVYKLSKEQQSRKFASVIAIKSLFCMALDQMPLLRSDLLAVAKQIDTERLAQEQAAENEGDEGDDKHGEDEDDNDDVRDDISVASETAPSNEHEERREEAKMAWYDGILNQLVAISTLVYDTTRAAQEHRNAIGAVQLHTATTTTTTSTAASCSSVTVEQALTEQVNGLSVRVNALKDHMAKSQALAEQVNGLSVRVNALKDHMASS